VARVSADGWVTHQDLVATEVPWLGNPPCGRGDLAGRERPVEFTFFWTADDRWEGTNFKVELDRAVSIRRSGGTV